MSKLDEILDFPAMGFGDYKVCPECMFSLVDAKQSIKQLFQELIDEVIGEDLDTETYDHKPYQVGYEAVVVRSSVINKIKSEQRHRAKELLKEL